ncbi:hypothetical protein IL090_002821, partial [Enterococcus hirae]|nr:hypothetical protein [Enterococcus hirae]
LVLNGNNHTIDFSQFMITSTIDANYVFKNLNTLNGTGIHGSLQLNRANVTLENVSHIGNEWLTAKNIVLVGNIDVNVNKDNGYTGILSCWLTPGGSILVKSGANVKLSQTTPTGNGALALPYCDNFTIEDNASLTIKTTTPLPWGIIGYTKTGMPINIGKNSTLNIESTSPSTRGINGPISSINVAKGGTLNVATASDYAIAATANNSTINLSGAKFNIQSTESNGLPLYMGSGGSIFFDKQNVRAWLKGTTTDPQYSWDNVTGVVNMSGANTTSALSNNTAFNALFKNQNFSRISSDGRATQELTKTTINEVKDTDTTVSGKGEPNGKIELKVGDQVITSGTVGSDGNYSLTIPKQSAGTVIKAVVSANGLTSEAHTTVVRTALAQTTISEINTETTQVSGKGEPNAPIKIMNGDQIIAQDVIGSDGNYTLTIPKQAKDSVIKAIVEKDGLTSKAQTIVTQGSLVQTTISNIDTNTTSVSGKGEPNAKIELKVGNQVIASDRIGSDGNYSLTIPKQSVGTVVKAVVSANGLTSEAHTTVTRADLAPTTISKVDSQTTVITGTGEPGGKIELLNGNQVIVHGYVGKDGHYSLTVMKQPAGSTIVARVTMAGKESQASTVVEEKFNLQAPVIDKFIE